MKKTPDLHLSAFAGHWRRLGPRLLKVCILSAAAGAGGCAAPRMMAPPAADYYPDAAIRMSQEGEVIVHFSVGAGGKSRLPELAKSSGVLRLDEAALRYVSTATFRSRGFNKQPLSARIRFVLKAGSESCPTSASDSGNDYVIYSCRDRDEERPMDVGVPIDRSRGLISIDCAPPFNVPSSRAVPFSRYQSKDAVHLPSNARGVPFTAAVNGSVLATDGDNRLLSAAPISMTRYPFHITTRGQKDTLPAVVERVQLQDGAPLRYFFAANKGNRRCPKTRRAGDCITAHVNHENPDWLKQLIAAHQVVDVTAAAAQAQGVFRVRPRGGFKRGRYYTILYGDGRNEQRIKLIIDGPLRPTATDRFAISPDGESTRDTPDDMWEWHCGMNAVIRRVGQRLRFDLPDDYRPYRDQLIYITERKRLPEGSTQPGGDPDRFERWAFNGIDLTPFGLGKISSDEKELVFTRCNDQDKPSVGGYVIRGQVGFLEMSDDFRLTPAIEIRFNEALCSDGPKK